MNNNNHGGARKGAGMKLGGKKKKPVYDEFQDHQVSGIRFTKTEYNRIMEVVNESGLSRSRWIKELILKTIGLYEKKP